MDFGAALSSLATGAGYAMQAQNAEQQRQLALEEHRAQLQTRQMQNLMMRREIDDRSNEEADVREGFKGLGEAVKTTEGQLKGIQNSIGIAASKGQYGVIQSLSKIATSLETDVRQQRANAYTELQQKGQEAAKSALLFQDNPSPETATEVVKAAQRLGIPKEQIPLDPQSPEFARFAKSLVTKGQTTEQIISHKQAEAKAEADRQEKIREFNARQQERIERSRETAAMRREGLELRKALAASVIEARRKRSGKGEGTKVGMIEQKVSDTIIRNSAQGVRVIDNILSAPHNATAGLFSKLKDGTMTEALIKGGTNIVTPEMDQEIAAIGAEMGIIISQVVTAGSGRAAALPVIQSFQSMTTPQVGDTPHMKLLRVANAGEILKLELQNITPGATPQLEANRQKMIEFLDKLPETKQVLALTPNPEKAKTMREYGALVKQGRTLTTKAQADADANKPVESKTLNGVTYHKNADGTWSTD